MPEKKFRIYSSINPVARAGDTVSIDVSQTLTGSGPILHTSGPTVEVQIQGPQVQISEADIVGVYPAAGSTNSPDNYMPHIALSRRTLPWERLGPVADPTSGTPWLALLLLTDADMRLATTLQLAPVTEALIKGAPQRPQAPRYIQGSLTPQTIPVSNLNSADKDQDTYKQLIKIPGITANTTITTIAIPAPTLKTLLPAKPEDLALLCHAKDVIDSPGNGTFTSIVISQRLPDAGDGDPAVPPALHTAVLVSLEQRTDIWTRLDKSEFINVIVLHSWTFTPSKGGDFQEVCKLIGYSPNGGVLRFGNLPDLVPATTPTPLTIGIGAALDADGYLIQPLDHVEQGDVVWRGPLRPFPPPKRSQGVALRAAPEQWTNQPATVKLDYSHATAFELGKLLALADAGIREDLREVHEQFSIPDKYFVAVNQLPAALQRPYWGIDQVPGESLETAQNQLQTALQGAQQGVVTIANQQGSGDFTGAAFLAQGWASAMTAAASLSASAATAAQVSQIDLTAADAVLAVNLPQQFPELTT